MRQMRGGEAQMSAIDETVRRAKGTDEPNR